MKKSIYFLAAIAILFFVSSCDSLHEPAIDLTKPVYFADVKAIFNANSFQCSQCHDGTSTGGKVRNANNKQVNVDVYEDVKLWANYPGDDKLKFKETFLYLALNPDGAHESYNMKKSVTSLTSGQITIINKWLADGAPEK